MTKVAVVILNYNGKKYLEEFLPSVIKHSPKAKIIVADNCSTDHSIEFLNSNFPNVETIQLDSNTGYAGGYNSALQRVEAEYYLLLNSDVEVTDGWLEPLVSYLDNHSAYAAVQPKILDYNQRQFFEYAGAAGGFMDKLGYPYCRGRILDTLEKDEGQYDSSKDVFWCSGACFLIRSRDFKEAGGFDPDFFAHMEEIDLCWRMLNADRKLACVPSSSVFHVGGGTLSKYNPNKTYLNFRNNLMMLAKNLPLTRLIVILPIRLVLDIVAGIKLWQEHSWGHFTAVLKAQIDFFISLKKSRKKTISKRDLKIRGRHYLIFEYFLLGKKTFNKINNTK